MERGPVQVDGHIPPGPRWQPFLCESAEPNILRRVAVTLVARDTPPPGTVADCNSSPSATKAPPELVASRARLHDQWLPRRLLYPRGRRRGREHFEGDAG